MAGAGAAVPTAKKHAVSLHGFSETMDTSQMLSWLSKDLGRDPEPVDLFSVGKLLYQGGSYVGAAKILQVYVDGPGSEMPGSHLLGYAYHMTNQRALALQYLKKCVNNGE
jgi:hypothetical protein